MENRIRTDANEMDKNNDAEKSVRIPVRLKKKILKKLKRALTPKLINSAELLIDKVLN